MKDYSQFGEQKIILEWFAKNKITTGNVLSIGENDGETLSNVRALLLMGWGGVLFEPLPGVYQKLWNLYEGVENVYCINHALGTETGTIDFYESGSHITPNDHGLLSTAKVSELKKWQGTQWQEFTKTTVKSITWADFYAINKKPAIFEFISIDAEGLDYEILSQIDLNETGTRMLMIEWNGDQLIRNKIQLYMMKYGFRLEYHNRVNLIYTR